MRNWLLGRRVGSFSWTTQHGVPGGSSGNSPAHVFFSASLGWSAKKENLILMRKRSFGTSERPTLRVMLWYPSDVIVLRLRARGGDGVSVQGCGAGVC